MLFCENILFLLSLGNAHSSMKQYQGACLCGLQLVLAEAGTGLTQCQAQFPLTLTDPMAYAAFRQPLHSLHWDLYRCLWKINEDGQQRHSFTSVPVF